MVVFFKSNGIKPVNLAISTQSFGVGKHPFNYYSITKFVVTLNIIIN